MIHVLITTRDYPHTGLERFSLQAVPELDSFVRDRYSNILGLEEINRCKEKNEAWATNNNAIDDAKKKDLDRRLKWSVIELVFKHERAGWTQDKVFFTDKKKNGIPVAILECNDVIVYLLPCTAVGKLSLDFRQQYTAKCIESVFNAISGDNSISRNDIYAIVHSGDVFDSSNKTKNGLICDDDVLTSKNLSDMAGLCHVYHFHHESTESRDNVYDAIVIPALLGKKDEISKNIIEQFFTEANEEKKWEMNTWEKMRSLNGNKAQSHEEH